MSRTQRWWCIAGGAALVLLISLLLVGWFHTSGEAAHVSSHEWQRSIRVEVWKTVREEGWRVPWGGRVVSSRMRARGSHKVGNTTVTDYDRWYTYDIDRWVWLEDRRTAGYGTSATWAFTGDLAAQNPPQLGNTRENGRSERYWLNLDCEGKPRTVALPQVRWCTIPDSTLLIADVNAFGVVRDVEMPEAE